MGICGHPKTIRRLREELAGDNAKHVNSYIQKARSQHNLVLLIVDDFHVVHTIQRHPLKRRKLSTWQPVSSISMKLYRAFQSRVRLITGLKICIARELSISEESWIISPSFYNITVTKRG